MRPNADIWNVLFFGPGHVEQFESCRGKIPATIEELTFLLHLAKEVQSAVKNGYRAKEPITLPPSPINPARIPGCLESYLSVECGWQVSLNKDGSIRLAPTPDE